MTENIEGLMGKEIRERLEDTGVPFNEEDVGILVYHYIQISGYVPNHETVRGLTRAYLLGFARSKDSRKTQ